MNVVITGSIAFDYLMTFPGRFTEHILPGQVDHLSVSFLVDEMRRQRGGCATNIAYSLALLGTTPRPMGTVGQDFGEYREWLEARGIDTSLIRDEPDLFTASFFVSTDRDGNQIASFYTGAMARARHLSFKSVEDAGQIDMAIISPNDPDAMVKYVEECRTLGIPYLYDPSQQIVRLCGDDLIEGLAGCSILVVNEYEFDLLRDKIGFSPEEIQNAPSRACVVTLGAQGSHIWASDQRYDIPAVPARQCSDPTGVGDAFRAGLVRAIGAGLSWPTAGRVGSLAATYVLEQPGPQSHFYTLGEFTARYWNHFGEGTELDLLMTEV